MNQKPTTMSFRSIKPYASFPLSPHKRGWCKKIGGRVRMICGHVEPQEALRIFHQKAPALYGHDTERTTSPTSENPAPRTAPPPAQCACERTVSELCDAFLDHKRDQLDSSDITGRTYHDHEQSLRRFARAVSGTVDTLTPLRFGAYRQQLAMTLGPHALSRHITCVKAMFRWAFESELISTSMRYGRNFDKASAASKRKAKTIKAHLHGENWFTPAEVRLLLSAADIGMKAMILLAINGGMGNSDLAMLPIAAIQFDNALIDFPRPKNGLARQITLWPETVEAVHAAIAARPRAQDACHANLAFLTPTGMPLVHEILHRDGNGKLTKIVPVNAVSIAFTKLLKRVGIKSADLPRHGLSFYGLRRTFRTLGDEESHDQHALARLMGHKIAGMAGVYVQRITIERLRAVTDAVRERIFLAGSTSASAARFGDDGMDSAAERLQAILNDL